MSFNSVLVANRGEIAVRILRGAKSLGFHTVAVYSEVDANAAHVKVADTAICIGGAAAAESYLNIEAVLQAAKTTGASAIHPGYGFLAENAEFARAIKKAGLVFIGPSPEAIDAMGNKAAAKAMMEVANVPTIPGFRGDQSDTALANAANEIGLPVMVKAASGGGGRGMRRVAEADELISAIQAARSEAQNAFGSGELIIEKALDGARHVEVQIFADQRGNTVHLGERDCSVQRRHQKLIEESPSPAVDTALRERMGTAAVNAAKAVSYEGAGTVEFLLDTGGEFYFLEMNTRLQVEHPVTELVTGQDLVAWQLKVASGEALPLTQDQITFNGHAIEVRLCAEDPYNDFLPQAGPVLFWQEPAGDVRFDHCLQTGVAINPFYDSMQGKLIAYGDNRADALRKLKQALEQTTLLGTKHNFDFLSDMLANEQFAAGMATTAFIAEQYPTKIEQNIRGFHKTLAAALCFHLKASTLWWQHSLNAELHNWSSAGAIPQSLTLNLGDDSLPFSILVEHDYLYSVSLGDKTNRVKIDSAAYGEVVYHCNGRRHIGHYAVHNEQLWLHSGGIHACYVDPEKLQTSSEDGGDDSVVRAPMDGKILAVTVATGDSVKKGQTLAILEAMKMEHQLLAGCDGKVADINATADTQVSSGTRLIEITPNN